MRVWTCTDHAGHWPVGAASVVVAPDEATARRLLGAALASQGLSDEDGFTLDEIDLTTPAAIVLQDGDY
jgi:hypothetical protein